MKRDQSKLPENEKDYIRPIINFISQSEAGNLGFKLSKEIKEMICGGARIATIRAYDNRNRELHLIETIQTCDKLKAIARAEKLGLWVSEDERIRARKDFANRIKCKLARKYE